MERCCEILEATPLQEEVEGQYQLKQGHVRVRRFTTDQRLAELKECQRSSRCIKGAVIPRAVSVTVKRPSPTLLPSAQIPSHHRRCT